MRLPHLPFAAAPPVSAAALLLVVALAGAQERDSIPGVQLGLLYEGAGLPALAVETFRANFEVREEAGAAEAILRRDLGFSDHFRMLGRYAGSVGGPDALDYDTWDELGAHYLVRGRLENPAGRISLVLEIHDVVYERLESTRRFVLPSRNDPDFRMAAHRVSDAVVLALTGVPGMAASRVVFRTSRDGGRTQELWIVDSDGEGLSRLTSLGTILLSPSWHPSGRRVVFTAMTEDGRHEIREQEVGRFEARTLAPGVEGTLMTPTYDPSGRSVVFVHDEGRRSRILAFDPVTSCCLREMTTNRWSLSSPDLGPDGRRLTFVSDRIGRPLIYQMDLEGGPPQILSPVQGYFTSPEWSPDGRLVVFHGAEKSGEPYQILVVDPRDRTTRQVTWEGWAEDPSWAPDSRHLVYQGEREGRRGLWVFDTGTGRTRLLVEDERADLPAWSPALGAR